MQKQWVVLLLLIMWHSMSSPVWPLWYKECTMEKDICSHRIYKRIWWMLVGEILTWNGRGNTHDGFTVGFGMMSLAMFHKSIFQVFWHILRHIQTSACQV